MVNRLKSKILPSQSHTYIGEYTATIPTPPSRSMEEEDLEDLKDVVRDEIELLPGFESWGVEAEIKVYEVIQSQDLFKPSSTVFP